jgi:outer membrane protein TolC
VPLPSLFATLLAALIATAAAAPTRARAQAQAQPLTLAAAIVAAVTLADQGRRAEALRGQGRAVRAQADSLVAEDPALRAKYLSDSLNDNTGYYEWEAMVDLPLWLPGQRPARRALAETLGLHADALERFLGWEMAGRVREAAWGTALAEGRTRYAGQALSDAKILEGQVARRVGAGDLARVDLLLAQQETLAREVELQAARADLDQATQGFTLLTGHRELPSPLEEPVSATAESSAELAADHPGIAAAEASLAQARAERGRVATERRANPTLSLGGKRTRDNGDSDPYTALALEVRIPFGLPSQAAPRLAEAERGYTDSAAERARLRLELATGLALAHTGYAAAQGALTTARRQQALAAEALGLMQRGFDLGEIDLATLLLERTRAREAGLALEVKRLELGRAAARLNQASGVVP